MSAAAGRAIALVGATATGKTTLAARIADQLGAELVCVDARQLYRELEIGTGKPSPAERARSPHHLFEQLRLGEPTSAGRWSRDARTVAAEVWARGASVLFVGGSGLYLDALHRGLSPEPPHDPAVRARLIAEVARDGAAASHARLLARDPESAARIAPGDRQRITRALEVLELSGRGVSSWRREPRTAALEADWALLELTTPLALIEHRIVQRTRQMFAQGLVEETRDLLAAGAGEALAALHAIGYDEAVGLLGGTLDRDEACRRTSLRTRQLAKRQRTWFRHQVDAVRLVSDDRSDERSLLAEALRAIARTHGLASG